VGRAAGVAVFKVTITIVLLGVRLCTGAGVVGGGAINGVWFTVTGVTGEVTGPVVFEGLPGDMHPVASTIRIIPAATSFAGTPARTVPEGLFSTPLSMDIIQSCREINMYKARQHEIS
jgi:hypothetical protein